MNHVSVLFRKSARGAQGGFREASVKHQTEPRHVPRSERKFRMRRKHPTLNTQHPIDAALGHPRAAFIGCWVLDVGCWMLIGRLEFAVSIRQPSARNQANITVPSRDHTAVGWLRTSNIKSGSRRSRRKKIPGGRSGNPTRRPAGRGAGKSIASSRARLSSRHTRSRR